MPKNLMARMARAASFSHLLGIKAEDEDQDNNEREDETAETEEDDTTEDNDSATRAEDQDEDETEASEEDEEFEDSDDDEEEDEESDDTQKERARCASIFSCKAAGVRPDIAASLAFETNMSAKQAVHVLKLAVQGQRASGAKRNRLASRMADLKHARVAPSSRSGKSSMTEAEKIVAAGKRHRGEF